MNTEFQGIINWMDPLLEKLLASPLRTLDQLNEIPNQGVYAFYKYDKPIYVGRSNNMRNRIKGHSAPNAGATCAFKLLRENDRHTDRLLTRELQDSTSKKLS